jgi:hypothetical protein
MATQDGAIIAQDLRTKHTDTTAVFTCNHQSAVRQLLFDGNGALISSSATHTRVWDRRMAGDRGAAFVAQVDGSRLAAASLGKLVLYTPDRSLAVYDCSTCGLVHSFGNTHPMLGSTSVLRTDGMSVVTGNARMLCATGLVLSASM